MNTKLWIIIDGQESNVNVTLALEALKEAAKTTKIDVYTEILTQNGLKNPLKVSPGQNDKLLIIGNIKAPAVFANLQCTTIALQEAVEAPEAVLKNAASQGGSFSADSGKNSKKIVAITSCPTGIAHTYMAAEGLKNGAVALGHQIRVETQGSVGAGTPLTTKEIADADFVIIAADLKIDLTRFGGKMVYVNGTKEAINNSIEFVKTAMAEAKLQPSDNETATPTSTTKTANTSRKIGGGYQHLMTGVSYMIPFVVAGGLCIAAAFALGGINAEGNLATFLMKLGKDGFALMVPILAGYIAFSIADRPGIAPGMIGGLLCNYLNAGFLGGIIAGFLAGYFVLWVNRSLPLPKNLQGLKPVLILPVAGTLVTGLVLYYIVGGPVADLNTFLVNWLKELGGTNSVFLGIILGAMIAVDLGGPINKAAYAFALAMMQAGLYGPIAATSVASITPPLAVALSTHLFKNRYTIEEREAGNASFVLGLAMITEGAIPFAARDPFRVIPSFIVGSCLAGAIAMITNLQIMAPHGGLFILPIPGAVSSLVSFAFALIAGTVASALLIGYWKKPITQTI